MKHIIIILSLLFTLTSQAQVKIDSAGTVYIGEVSPLRDTGSQNPIPGIDTVKAKILVIDKMVTLINGWIVREYHKARAVDESGHRYYRKVYDESQPVFLMTNTARVIPDSSVWNYKIQNW